MDEVIKVSIGSEPSQYLPAEVLKSSILRRTSRPVEFTESWNPTQGWHRLMLECPPVKRGTKFSIWRWLCPLSFENAERAIYLDADQIVLADIAELWESLPAGKAFGAVINAIGIFGKKVPEPDHVQTSVMVMDLHQCARLPSDLNLCDTEGLEHFITRHRAFGLSYRDMMQAALVPRDRIHELPPEWNHFGIVTPETKLCHFSHVASQPYRNKSHPFANVWQAELEASIEAGHVTMDLLKQEVDAGHIDGIYLKRLRGRAAV